MADVAATLIREQVLTPEAAARALAALQGLRKEGVTAWRGAQAPRLPDPTAAWVGVVKPLDEAEPGSGVDVPAGEEGLELVGLAESMFETPFREPTPARPRPADARGPAAPAEAQATPPAPEGGT